MTLQLAHASHWLVQVAYFLPVLAFLLWLGWTTLKDKRQRGGADSNRQPPG